MLMLRAGIANACEPSGWQVETTPFLRCLALMESAQDRFEVHNACVDPIEIRPAACEEPCAETLRLEPGERELLELATPDRDGIHIVFDYEQSEQTGTIDFTYDLNACSSEDGCSISPPHSRHSMLSIGAFLVIVTILTARRAGRSRR